MTHNQFDNEYYVMSMDGANNHPLLAWRDTDYDLFLGAESINEKDLEIPFTKIVAKLRRVVQQAQAV